MLKKSILVIVALVATWVTSLYWSYTEVSCDVDPVYSQYSCNQCFDWGTLEVGTNISYLEDLWVNDTDTPKLLYKEEQIMPVMHELNGAVLNKNPSGDDFWEYTPQVEELFDEEYQGYVLPVDQTIPWIQSTLGASYLVEKLPSKWENAWILVYDITSHNILPWDDITFDDVAHKECVVYTSTVETPAPTPTPTPEPTPVPEEMTKVETGPEMYFVIIIMAFLLGMVAMNRRTLLEKINK